MATKVRVLFAAAALALAVAALSGCASQAGGSQSGAGSSAAAKVRAELSACISKTGLTQLLTSSGRDSLYSCLDGLVPPSARTTFRDCVASAAVSDQIWTSSGRATFLDVDGPDCLNAAVS